jgi:N-alpha-acetyltransferase 38, NatC auxiliary subunit
MIPTETTSAKSTDVDIGLPVNPAKVSWSLKLQPKPQVTIKLQETPGRQKLRSWLNKYFRIKLTDGRTLIGLFLCTDADSNIILGITTEFRDEEERTLGLVIVPKKHIVSIEVDKTPQFDPNQVM